MTDIADIKKIGPYHEGIRAFEKAHETNSTANTCICPYAFDTCDGELWLKGFHSAQSQVSFDKQDKYKMRKPLNNVIIAMCKGESPCT